MPDYLGPTQTRVLDAEDRNFDTVVVQKKKPALSCEWNLLEEIQSVKTQELIRSTTPSGWLVVGETRENVPESACLAGDVLTSPSLPANSFKLISNDNSRANRKNAALVNGWKILVQGTAMNGEDNLILLPIPPTDNYRIDFVFLEVWKKLITPTDPIYRYGNKLYGGTNFPGPDGATNDLIDPFKGYETSLRIQLQYRIRVAPGLIATTGIDIENYPSGFDPNMVLAQGAMAAPLSDYSYTQFSSLTDIGLWRAGLGDTAPTPGQPSDSQVKLGTVDGYSYAIPMFVVFRRNSTAYNYNTNSNGSIKSLTDYTNGVSSDRPDNKYNNWITAGDILDMRHLVSLSGENYRDLAKRSFEKFISGKLSSKLKKVTLGGENFGTRLLKVDAVAPVDEAGSEKIGVGQAVQRRFSNAGGIQKKTLVQKAVVLPLLFSNGSTFTITSADLPNNSSIVSVDNVYARLTTTTNALLSCSPTSGSLPLTITINSGLPGISQSLVAECTVQYLSGTNGFADVPEEVYEAREKNANVSIPINNEIVVRDSTRVSTLQGIKYQTVKDRGARDTETYDFGIQMSYHMVGNGGLAYVVPRTISGYTVLSVAGVKVGGSSSFRTITSITRNATSYTVTFVPPVALANVDVEFILYVTTKFFEANIQGQGITETYEMLELTGTKKTDLVYRLDSTNKPIIALAVNAVDGVPYGYGASGARYSISSPLNRTTRESLFSFDTTFSGDPHRDLPVTIPVLTHSAIAPAETYNFFYREIPYQGQLTSSTQGRIEAVGPAITTTAGSGAITDYTYSTGSIYMNNDTTVHGVGTDWVNTVKAGYVITVDTTKEFKISSVVNPTTLILSTDGTTAGTSYVITAKDQPFFNNPNIIDQLPTFSTVNDQSGTSVEIGFINSEVAPTLENQILIRKQDIVGIPPRDLTVGVGAADRGRSGIIMASDKAPLGSGHMGLSYSKLGVPASYQKTYQSWLFNEVKDGTDGRLFLMVAGTETDNSLSRCFFNDATTADVVDLVEMAGRPLITKRNDL
jgi:hypothetical protein